MLFGFAFVFVFACVFVFVRPLPHLKSLDTDDSVAAGGPVGNLTPEAKHRDIKAGLFSLTGGPARVTQPDKRTRRNVIPTNQPFSFHRHSWSHPFPKLENFDQVIWKEEHIGTLYTTVHLGADDCLLYLKIMILMQHL